jgi:hypothetical protein
LPFHYSIPISKMQITKISIKKNFLQHLPTFKKVGNICVFLFLFFAFFEAKAQKQNKQDSTKTNKKDSISYGPNTTRFFYEEDIFLNKNEARALDTGINNLHRFNYLQKNENLYQDAGNMGTAMRSIYYQSPDQIGTNLGFANYDLYIQNPKKRKYYNTMSPLTDIYIGQGGNFRSLITVNFARNITPLWNVGIFYHRVGSNKVYGRASRRNDPQALLNNYGIHTNFASRNRRYKLVASLNYYDNIVFESGGYFLSNPKNIDTLFQIEAGGLNFNLDGAVSTQTSRHIHLYHQIGVFDTVKFQIFHSYDYIKQINSYEDRKFAWDTLPNATQKGNALFYVPHQADGKNLSYFNPKRVGATVPYTVDYTLNDNKAGLKGKIQNFKYMGYVQLRTYALQTDFVRQIPTATLRDSSITRKIAAEFFVGGNLRYEFNDSMRIDANLDYLVGGDYRIRGVFQRGLWQAGYERMSYRPTLMQRQFNGNFVQWNNSYFVNTELDRIFGGIEIKLPFIKLNPYASLTNLIDYVYYDEKGQAQQKQEVVIGNPSTYLNLNEISTSKQNISILQAGLNWNFKWRKWHNNTNLIYTRNLGANLIRMPEWLVNSQFYYESPLFKSALFAQIGVDFHWKSAYYANSFMPVTQEFHLQNKFLVENYINADLFMNFRMKRALLFLKINNLLQDFVKVGYFQTPLYFAQSRGFELGVNWLFFD